MKRVQITPREGWQAKVEDLGFYWHTLATDPGVDPTYWDEGHAYELTAAEVDAVEEASQLLYRMCLSAVDHVISNRMLHQLAIPAEFHPLVEKSWERQDLDLYGRFDFAMTPSGVPKMLEFNADTPTSLVEASVIQWFWMEDYARRTGRRLDQFNSIHERMIEVIRDAGQKLLGPSESFYFSAVAENLEDKGTAEYLRDCAIQAGLNTQYIDIESIGWNGTSFTNLDEKPINTIFKLYPWEWLIREEFGHHMISEPWDVLEPAWKLILSNKGILPILWELYPDHPNLLPAYWQSSRLKGDFVEKPLLSREGADVKIIRNGQVTNDVLKRGYGGEGVIYQEYMPLTKYDGMTPILGSWIVGGRACGLGIREDVNEVTGNTSHFVPHFFESND